MAVQFAQPYRFTEQQLACMADAGILPRIGTDLIDGVPYRCGARVRLSGEDYERLSAVRAAGRAGDESASWPQSPGLTARPSLRPWTLPLRGRGLIGRRTADPKIHGEQADGSTRRSAAEPGPGGSMGAC